MAARLLILPRGYRLGGGMCHTALQQLPAAVTTATTSSCDAANNHAFASLVRWWCGGGGGSAMKRNQRRKEIVVCGKWETLLQPPDSIWVLLPLLQVQPARLPVTTSLVLVFNTAAVTLLYAATGMTTPPLAYEAPPALRHQHYHLLCC